MENVLEQIVGPVEDEFDEESPDIVEQDPRHFLIRGTTPLDRVRRRLEVDLDLDDPSVHTFSGYLVAKTGKLLEAGEKLELDGLFAEVLATKHGRATRVRLTIS